MALRFLVPSSALFGLLVVAPAASADGGVSIREKVSHPIYLWIDGTPVGKLKKTHQAQLAVGTHELWFAMDEDAVYTYCHGTVDVTDGATVEVTVKPLKCEGFTAPDAVGESTASAGGKIAFRMPRGEQFCCSAQVDAKGAYPFYLHPRRSLNVAAGTHHIEITEQSSSRTLDRGVVAVAPGETLWLTCSESGCLGIEHP